MDGPIDWARVNKNLRCPICGEKAHVSAGTDGTEGEHTHRFKISREMARELSKPGDDERAEMRAEALRLLAEAGVDKGTAKALRGLVSTPAQGGGNHE